MPDSDGASAARVSFVPSGALDDALRRLEALSAREADGNPSIANELGAIAGLLRDRGEGDVAALPLIVNAEAPVEERSRALRSLRLEMLSQVTVFALRARVEATQEFIAALRVRSADVHHARVDGLELVLAREFDGDPELGVALGARAALAPPCAAVDAPAAWHDAKLGLRLSRPSKRAVGPYSLDEAVLVDGSILGGLALLAQHLTVEQIESNADVRRLEELVNDLGEDMLVWLEAVAATESLRKAAALVHMHHNSLAHRVARAEQYLGYSVSVPYGRNRLFIALVLRRLRDTGRLLERDRASWSGIAAS